MINGKFYTGLPEKMMGHTNGPNRLKTNFFWPDESKMQQVDKNKIRAKIRREQTPDLTESPRIKNDIDPVALHNKQLSSKIAFYDEVEPKINNRKIQKTHIIQENNVQVKKPDTFTSKIQFYDFENESSTRITPKTNKNSKTEVEKNTKNSPKTRDKRISFTETKIRDKSPAPKGILKNNESVSLRRAPTPKMPRSSKMNISKSKSMSDIAGDDNIQVIENDVRNVSISSRRDDEYFEADNDPVPTIPLRRKQMQPAPVIRRARPNTEYYEDEYQEYERRPRSQIYRDQPIRNTRTVDYEEPFFDYEYDIPPSRKIIQRRPEVQSYSRTVNFRQRRQEYDDVEDYDDSPRVPVVKPRIRNNTTLRSDNYDELHQVNNHKSQNRNSRNFTVDEQENDRRHDYTTKNNSNDIDTAKKPNNLTPKITSPPSSDESNNRAQRHLVSNIGFGNDSLNNNTTRRIRSSAVSRVSVGLPDS